MKVLMVCLGNICRSPLAEGILRHILKKEGLDAFVDSAGTAAYHVGEPPDPRSTDIARIHGIDISGQRARRFSQNDFRTFDLIFVMDRSNYADILALARDSHDAAKVELILNMSRPGSDAEVPDPYYGGQDGFSRVYHMLDEACGQIADRIRQQENNK
jgi:protein-tyrosine phosphatase